MSKQLSAGDIIEARCTRCKAVTNHTIIAMIGGQPVRVRCNTCDGDHNYRAPRVKSEPARKTSPARQPGAQRKPKAVMQDEQQWQEAAARLRSGQSVPYAMDRSFKKGDAVDHPAFGMGIVVDMVPPNKVEILFESGRKLLRCKL
ncbi:MAG: hypothetical protein PHC98_11290 [Syntrophotalea acetylenica]|uniref:hypothetical protein n=1 Tax=Syntrophotalea acetylenica TaxID=29542 RepID=UPI002A35F190|nr:hypothetical protein [Syntrophotalea acetylenica]MDD4458148.1 hypothetical protein [Syntrophotalea acetylenica]MDY0262595.1 hypothetical protein [Syntrophotalea acetylenica]